MTDQERLECIKRSNTLFTSGISREDGDWLVARLEEAWVELARLREAARVVIQHSEGQHLDWVCTCWENLNAALDQPEQPEE